MLTGGRRVSQGCPGMWGRGVGRAMLCHCPVPVSKSSPLSPLFAIFPLYLGCNESLNLYSCTRAIQRHSQRGKHRGLFAPRRGNPTRAWSVTTEQELLLMMMTMQWDNYRAAELKDKLLMHASAVVLTSEFLFLTRIIPSSQVFHGEANA